MAGGPTYRSSRAPSTLAVAIDLLQHRTSLLTNFTSGDCLGLFGLYMFNKEHVSTWREK